jgi:hypothetical protein
MYVCKIVLILFIFQVTWVVESGRVIWVPLDPDLESLPNPHQESKSFSNMLIYVFILCRTCCIVSIQPEFGSVQVICEAGIGKLIVLHWNLIQTQLLV